MTFKNQLRELKDLYDQGENIIEHLRKLAETDHNTSEMVQVSYDLQSGSYVRNFKKNPGPKTEYCKLLAREIADLGSFDSMLLVGCGEAITLSLVLKHLENKPSKVYGIDISWSRLKYGNSFAQEMGVDVNLLMADLFQLPFQNSSIDLVLTNHSLEPNGGREQEALVELYRVAKRVIFMNEPSFEFGDEIARDRIEKHGYIKNLSKHANDLGYDVVRNEPFGKSMNPKNPTGMTIIEVKKEHEEISNSPLACPLAKRPLDYKNGCYFSPDSLLAYPIIDDIPCLLESNGVIATHFDV